MAELEDEDTFPNDYDDLDFDSIPELQAPTIHNHDVSVPSAVPRDFVPPRALSPASSTRSNSVEDMDPSFLAAVDALEARALNEMSRDSDLLSRAETAGHPTDGKVPDSPQSEGTISSSQVCEYSIQSVDVSMNRKGKRKAESQEDPDVRSILVGYETELTCPICYDLLVGAQVANPCGHTCCGECGYGWLARSECTPTCAVCRSRLSVQKPLLPNFSVDNVVRQHLQALARSGLPEWQEKGYRSIEWNKRLESWKEQAAVRAKENSKETSRPRRRQARYYQVDEYSYAAPWLIDESMDDDEGAIVAHVVPRRGTRSRR